MPSGNVQILKKALILRQSCDVRSFLGLPRKSRTWLIRSVRGAFGHLMNKFHIEMRGNTGSSSRVRDPTALYTAAGGKSDSRSQLDVQSSSQ